MLFQMTDRVEVGEAIAVRSASVEATSRLTASEISKRIQSTGQLMLATSVMREVEENVFSSCTDDVPDLADRLLRARDLGSHLFEVGVFPDSGNYEALRTVFNVDGAAKLVLSISHSDGIERYDGIFGNHISMDELGLVIPSVHTISLSGDYGSHVMSTHASYTLSGYDTPRPRFGGSYAYEEDDYWMSSGLPGMERTLEGMIADFDSYMRLSDSVDSRVIDIQ